MKKANENSVSCAELVKTQKLADKLKHLVDKRLEHLDADYMHKDEATRICVELQGVQAGIDSIYNLLGLLELAPGQYENDRMEAHRQALSSSEKMKRRVRDKIEGKPTTVTKRQLIVLKNIPRYGHCTIPKKIFNHSLDSITRIWVAFPEYKDGQIPVHQKNAFLEDQGHDWTKTSKGVNYSGILRMGGDGEDRNAKNSGRILVEYEITRRRKSK